MSGVYDGFNVRISAQTEAVMGDEKDVPSRYLYELLYAVGMFTPGADTSTHFPIL